MGKGTQSYRIQLWGYGMKFETLNFLLLLDWWFKLKLFLYYNQGIYIFIYFSIYKNNDYDSNRKNKKTRITAVPGSNPGIGMDVCVPQPKMCQTKNLIN